MVPSALEHALLAFEGWQASMPTPAAEYDWQDTIFGASVSLDWQRLRWYGTHNTAVMFPALIDFLTDAETPLFYIEELRGMVAAHSPLQMTSWIEAVPGSIDMGWYFDGRFTIDRLPQPFHGIITAVELNDIIRFGMSLGGDDRYCELLFRLPGETLREKLATATERFAKLGTSLMSARLEAILQSDEEAHDVFLSTWLLPDGVLKLGAQVWSPDTTIVLMAADEQYQRFDRRQLAEFEGTLGVTETETLEVVHLAGGIGLEAHYELD